MSLRRFKISWLGRPVDTTLYLQMTLFIRSFCLKIWRITLSNWNICTCFQWQSTGIPCSHKISAILARQENLQTYVQAFLSFDAYYRTYGTADLLPNSDAVNQPLQYDTQTSRAIADDGNDKEKVRVIAPHVRRQSERPWKARIRSGIEGPFGPKCPKKCEYYKGLRHI